MNEPRKIIEPKKISVKQMVVIMPLPLPSGAQHNAFVINTIAGTKPNAHPATVPPIHRAIEDRLVTLAKVSIS
jgi:hypothetical protein